MEKSDLMQLVGKTAFEHLTHDELVVFASEVFDAALSLTDKDDALDTIDIFKLINKKVFYAISLGASRFSPELTENFNDMTKVIKEK